MYEWIIAWQYLKQHFNGLSEGEKSEASIRNRRNYNQKKQNKIRKKNTWDLLAVLLVKTYNSNHKGKGSKIRGAQLHPCTFSLPGEFTWSVLHLCVQTDMGEALIVE